MDTQRRWIGYDWMKLIIALVLLALLLILFLRGCAGIPSTAAGQATQTGQPAVGQAQPTDTSVAPANTVAVQASPTPAAGQTTATIPPIPTPTSSPVAASTATAGQTTATIPPIPTPTSSPVAAPTATAAATTPATEAATASATPAATATALAQPAPVDCPLAQPSRLAVGKQAIVVTNLNLRKAAGLDQPVLHVSPPNTKVDIVGGPVCTPYQKGAYLWWNVKLPDGTTGWSAEASLSKNFYFLQPVK